MDPMEVPIVRFDPPIPASDVRFTRTLKPTKTTLQGTSRAVAAAAANGGGAATGVNTTPLLEDILNAIIPPRPVAGGANAASSSTFGSKREDSAATTATNMVQLVSSQPASRLDAIHLQEVLDNRLVLRQAREMGICPVRNEIYADVFDELIRQVTIGSPERGLLLLRLRDELRMTLEAQKGLYECSVAFGVRKSAVAEVGLPAMRQRIAQLKKEKEQLEAQVQTYLLKMDEFEKKVQDDRLVDEKTHNDEVGFFRKTNQQLSTHLKTETEKANSKK